jgi:hypothetical protein
MTEEIRLIYIMCKNKRIRIVCKFNSVSLSSSLKLYLSKLSGKWAEVSHVHECRGHPSHLIRYR